MRPIVWSLSLLLIPATFAGCATQVEESGLPTAPRGVIEATGVVKGILTLRDNCLRLKSGSEDYLVIWTQGTRLNRNATRPSWSTSDRRW